MALESPLFQSSLDLFAHSIEHYNWGTNKDRKFTILHLANSVELIFKDLLLDLGVSIYQGSKETVGIHKAIALLTNETNKIEIPNLNKLELLIDERNSLQHRYGFPNEITTIFYMEATYMFFSKFLEENYNLKIDKVLKDYLKPDDLTAFQLRQVKSIHELDQLLKISIIHPVGALLSAYTYLEKQQSQLREIMIEALSEKYKDNQYDREMKYTLLRTMRIEYLPRLFEIYGINLDSETVKRFSEVRRERNQIAHGENEPTSEHVNETITFIKGIDPKLKELKEKVINEPLKSLKERIERINTRAKYNEVDRNLFIEGDYTDQSKENE